MFMIKFLLLFFISISFVSAQDPIENKRLELIHQAKTQKVLNKLKQDYKDYIKKSDEFHENCDRMKNNLTFEYGTSTYVDDDIILWEYFYHHLEGKKCIRIAFPIREFLNAEDASVLFYVSRISLWQELPWMAQIKLNYTRYSNYLCNLAHYYKPSDKENYVIEYNLCGEEALVQGTFLFEGGPALIAL